MDKTKYWIGSIIFIFAIVWTLDGMFNLMGANLSVIPTTPIGIFIVLFSIWLVDFLRHDKNS